MSERAQPVLTGLPAGAVSSTVTRDLTDGWVITSTAPGACSHPDDLDAGALWQPATVPGTVALAMQPRDLDAHHAYDASDWWYRCSIPRSAFGGADGARRTLRLDGLATLAEVWLNGEHVLTSTNMFMAFEIDVTGIIDDRNDLVIAFRSLDAAIGQKRPRPRWKTKLVEQQQLRWFRTTLLGRIPGWTPAIAPVGPWRSVWLESHTGLNVRSLDLRSRVRNRDGLVEVAATLDAATDGVALQAAVLRVGDHRVSLEVSAAAARAWHIRGSALLEGPDLWWPATHGTPALHACALELETSLGRVSIDCGRIGFRDIRLDRTNGKIEVVVNGVPVFCRGSCWTSNDIVSLIGDPARMQRTLRLLAEAHGNMVRVGGTMVYESDDFYRACDELGVMVWQDFMFANMDYPVGDQDFAAAVHAEADQQLRRLSRHPSVVVFCGGSEVEQQAAMFGAAPAIWSNTFFAGTLPELIEEHAPGTPYWPSTPTGGVLPFHVGEGLSHYYGIGAYRRPLEDVRLAGVRFTPECLGFSHVPSADNLERLTPSGAVPPHHPAWKRGVPRDTGAGWDFEDVRDHYLEQLYGVHAARLRSEDLDRYLSLSRVVTGEAMAHAFAEWRRAGDPCAGALTWFLQDLRPGAGWGLIDSDGAPKAAYYHLRRAWAPRCVRLLDRGLDGLVALVVNEGVAPLEADLELFVLAQGSASVADGHATVRAAPGEAVEVSVEGIVGHFLDSTYAYRFGPPRHEAVVARLSAGGSLLSEDVYRPVRSSMTPAGSSPSATVQRRSDDCVLLTLATDSLLYDVRIDVPDYRPADNHFCLAPGRPYAVPLRRVAGSTRSFHGYVEALNLREGVPLPQPD